jgi:Fe-S-cluster-containing hydrogenase component 2
MVFQDMCMGCWDCIEACPLDAVFVKNVSWRETFSFKVLILNPKSCPSSRSGGKWTIEWKTPVEIWKWQMACQSAPVFRRFLVLRCDQQPWSVRKKSQLADVRHPGERQDPVISRTSGCRVKPGMTSRRLFTRSSILEMLQPPYTRAGQKAYVTGSIRSFADVESVFYP